MQRSTKCTFGMLNYLWLIVAGVLMGSSAVYGRAAGPLAPSMDGAGSAGTPLYALSVSAGNKILLPLYSKWVEVLLRSGDRKVGKLADIRVSYIALRISAKSTLRIKRKIIVRVVVTKRPARARAVAPRTQPRAQAQTPAQRLQKNTARLKAVVGKTVRLELNDGRHMDGVVRAVDTAHVTLETSAGTEQVALADVFRVLIAKRRRPKPVERGPHANASRSDASRYRSRATAMVPPSHTPRQPASARFRRDLMTKYLGLKISGAHVRNWGIGLLIGGVVLSAIGAGMLAGARLAAGTRAGLAMSSIGGTMVLPGIIMWCAGQVRHNRGVDMENTLLLTR